MIEVVLTQIAEGDWFEFYSKFGDRFEVPFRRALKLLSGNPEIAPRSRIDNQFRQMRIQKTNCSIFYRHIGDRVIISRIIDMRQSSEFIRKMIPR